MSGPGLSDEPCALHRPQKLADPMTPALPSARCMCTMWERGRSHARSTGKSTRPEGELEVCYCWKWFRSTLEREQSDTSSALHPHRVPSTDPKPSRTAPTHTKQYRQSRQCTCTLQLIQAMPSQLMNVCVKLNLSCGTLYRNAAKPHLLPPGWVAVLLPGLVYVLPPRINMVSLLLDGRGACAS